MKILSRLMIAAAILAILSYFWLTRDPTTQLLDASGNALTAGSAVNRFAGAIGNPPIEEARALINRKQFLAAKEKLFQIIEDTEHDGEACMLLCDVSRELRDVKLAVDYGLKATSLLPESAEAHLSYAKALGLQMFSNMQGVGGMFSAMTQAGHLKNVLNRVIKLNPEDTEARTMLVYSNMAPRPFGNIDTAIELSREVELRDPVRGKQLLAACYTRNKETERAISLLLEAIAESPENSIFHLTLANIYAEQKRFEDADAEYEAARLGQKSDAHYRSLYGQARMRIQNKFEPDRAVELLVEFIADEPEGEEVPSLAHACWRKGNALEQLGKTKEARDAYEASLRREPGLELAIKSLEGLRK